MRIRYRNRDSQQSAHNERMTKAGWKDLRAKKKCF